MHIISARYSRALKIYDFSTRYVVLYTNKFELNKHQAFVSYLHTLYISMLLLP